LYVSFTSRDGGSRLAQTLIANISRKLMRGSKRRNPIVLRNDDEVGKRRMQRGVTATSVVGASVVEG